MLAWVYAALMRWKLDIQQAGDAYNLVDRETGLPNGKAFLEAEVAPGTIGVCCVRVVHQASAGDVVTALQSATQRIRDHGFAEDIFRIDLETLAFHLDVNNVHKLRDTLYGVTAESNLFGAWPLEDLMTTYIGVAFSRRDDIASALTRAGEAAQSALSRCIPFAIARTVQQEISRTGGNVTTLRPYRPVLNISTGQICGAEFTQTLTPDIATELMTQICAVLGSQEFRQHRYHEARLWINIEVEVLDDLQLWDRVGYYLTINPDIPLHLTIGVNNLDTVIRGGVRDNQLVTLRKLGVECSFLGLGLKETIDFASLRRQRSTQMKLCDTLSGYSYIAGERLLRASADLGREVSRSIFVPNLTTEADVAAAKAASIDYATGKAVGEVMALDELMATLQRQRRIS